MEFKEIEKEFDKIWKKELEEKINKFFNTQDTEFIKATCLLAYTEGLTTKNN